MAGRVAFAGAAVHVSTGGWRVHADYSVRGRVAYQEGVSRGQKGERCVSVEVDGDGCWRGVPAAIPTELIGQRPRVHM